jgi:hypothetical protein
MNIEWLKGFEAGAKTQRKKDIEQMAYLIENLNVKGIGKELKKRIIQAVNEGMGDK